LAATAKLNSRPSPILSPVPRLALDADRLLIRDKYLRILALEAIALSLILSATLYVLAGSPYGAAALLAPPAIVSAKWLGWEARRRRRVMRVYRVVGASSIIAPVIGGLGGYHPSIDVKLTLVEAAHLDHLVRYIDYEERRRGERVVLILDEDGGVLASASLDRPPRLETLRSLG